MSIKAQIDEIHHVKSFLAFSFCSWSDESRFTRSRAASLFSLVSKKMYLKHFIALSERKVGFMKKKFKKCSFATVFSRSADHEVIDKWHTRILVRSNVNISILSLFCILKLWTVKSLRSSRLSNRRLASSNSIVCSCLKYFRKKNTKEITGGRSVSRAIERQLLNVRVDNSLCMAINPRFQGQKSLHVNAHLLMDRFHHWCDLFEMDEHQMLFWVCVFLKTCTS